MHKARAKLLWQSLPRFLRCVWPGLLQSADLHQHSWWWEQLKSASAQCSRQHQPTGTKVHFPALAGHAQAVLGDTWTHKQGWAKVQLQSSLAAHLGVRVAGSVISFLCYPDRDCLSRSAGTAGEEKLPLCLGTVRMSYLGFGFYVSWEPSVSVCMGPVWQIESPASAAFQKSHLPQKNRMSSLNIH